jgi:putative thioredoxin
MTTQATDSIETSFIKTITTENFDSDVIQASASIPVLIVFWADWCESCKGLLPIVESFATAFGGAFILAKINADEQPQLAQQVGVQNLPTCVLIKEGQMLDHFVGLQKEEDVKLFLEKHIQPIGPSIIEQADDMVAQGRIDEALAMLQSAWLADEKNGSLIAKLIETLLVGERLEDAKALAASLKEELKLDLEVKKVLALLELEEQAENLPETAALEATYKADPSSKNAHELAIVYNATRQFEPAFELLIKVMQTDKAYTDVRPTLLDMFKTVADVEMVTNYRRKMYALMY